MIRPALAAALAAALLALAAPASAATCSGLPAAGTSCVFAGPGAGSGKVNDPNSVAVDPVSGDVYVGEFNNGRVSEFDPEGRFLRAFGVGVSDGSGELQTCTTVCIQGANTEPTALAADASGDLYVFYGATSTVEKYDFDPLTERFELLRSFGSPGTGPGQFSGEAHPLALDAAGQLWVGDAERVEEFSEAGEYLSEVHLPEVSGARQIGALAIDSAGDFYAINRNEAEQGHSVPGVRRYSSTGTPIETLDEAGHPQALALDPATGDLFVGDCPGGGGGTSCPGYTLLTYDPSGAQTAAFGSGEVIGHPGGSYFGTGNALAFGDAAQALYAASSAPEANSAAQIFALPEPGPLPVSGTTEATAVQKTAATLCAEINPEGASTTAHFQYITEASYEEDGGQFGPGTVETAESAPLGEDFSPHPLCQAISPLTSATAYRLRVIATNPNGTVDGRPAEFSSLPPAAIDSTGVSEVTADSATLEAEIDPLGEATSWRFEYLTEAAWLADGESFAGATRTPEEPLGAGSADVSVSRHLQGLAPATAYRFRAVVRNQLSEVQFGGDFPGPTRAFITQAAAAALLPDYRAWEQVSPPDKHGAGLGGISERRVIQAAASGDAITYAATAPTEAAPPGNDAITQLLSARGPAGWSSLDLNVPHRAPTGAAVNPEYRFFSADLSRALLQPNGSFEPALSPRASEQTPYLRSDFPPAEPTALCSSGCYSPLVTGAAAVANVPPGTEFGTGARPCMGFLPCGPRFLGATADLAHVVLRSQVALTETPLPGGAGARGLYEWTAAAPPSEQLRLLSVLPGGEPAPVGAQPALGAPNPSEADSSSNARGAISADGSRVVFSANGHLYLRVNATEAPTASGQCSAAEPGRACTVQLDAVQGGPGASEPPAASFQLAAADTTRVLFTDSQQLTPGSGGASQRGGDLYECRIVEEAGGPRCELTDLTPETGGEAAGVQGLLPGASADGSWLYFVADGVLAGNTVDHGGGTEEAEPGSCVAFTSVADVSADRTCNLYLDHEGEISFLAGLSEADAASWSGFGATLDGLTARVSPSGRWLAFMSQRPLTGYDNRDAASGEPDEEVFLYHAAAGAGEGKLVCASCDPTGARPHGVRYRQLFGGLAGGFEVWPQDSTWLAANIPGWTPQALSSALYQSRYLSDSGRLFFNSSDALVPQDSNGAEDVYQYEPPQGSAEEPPNDTCTTSSPTYGPASGGCVDLISSGSSPTESAFLDASESGDDVFFLTSAKLAPTDTDTSIDLYDARVGGGFPEAARPVECQGDACQAPATPPAGQTPGSLTYQGPGNLLECPKGQKPKGGRCVKQKAKKKKQRHHKKHRAHHHKKHKGKRHKRAHRYGGRR